MTTTNPPFDWDGYWARVGTNATNIPGTVYRGRLIFSLLGALGRDDRLLDIGCGLGELDEALHATYPETPIRGTDYAESAVRQTAARVPDGTFFVRDLLVPEEVPDELAGWATHAVCSEVLEHVEDPIELLSNARAYLAPGCCLVVTVPGGPRTAFDKAIGHLRHFTPAMLEIVLKRAGYEVERIERAGFPFHNLYKLAVLARGRRVMGDLDPAAHDGGLGTPVRLAQSVFNRAFRANLDASPFGWQVVSRAWLR